MSTTDATRQTAGADLRQELKGHDTITTVTEWRGYTAYVRLLIVKRNSIIDITHRAGAAMNRQTIHGVDKPYGLKYGGGGYSKPFQAVYDLGRALYPNGHRHTAKGCHSNDHFNGWDGKSKHRDGGYKFKQSEL